MAGKGLSAETRAAIEKWAPKIDKMARQRYKVSGRALLGKLVIGESGDNAEATSGAGAHGRTQFMPGSRDIAMKKFGIDPWRSADEAVHGAVLHLQGKINGSKGLEGYNPGDPNYPRYILNQKVGDLGGGSTKAPATVSSSAGFTTKTLEQTSIETKTDDEGAIIDSLLAGKNGRQGKSLAFDIADRLASGNYTTETPTVTKTKVAVPTVEQGTAVKVRNSDKSGSKVLELIYNDGGKGFGIKDGQTVNGPQFYSGVWAGHANHVHVAAGPKTVVELGKLAQKMGLHVGENSHFGGVDKGAHTKNSYHYKNEAIDVSGDAKLMKKYAKAVAEYNRTHKMPQL